MTTAAKKFNAVRATRLALLIVISLTAGVSTALLHPPQLTQALQGVQTLSFAHDTATADTLGQLLRHRSGHDQERR